MDPASANPSLALHHGVGNTGRVWGPLIPHLPDFDCIAPDLPGHGVANRQRWQSLEDAAHRVLDQLGGRATHLAAVSLGSYVALHMLRLAPTQFRSAVLSGMHPGGMSNRILMKMMSGAISLVVSRPGLARKNALAMKIPDDQIDLYIDGAAQVRPQAFRRATNQVVDFEMPQGIERVETHVTVAAGSKEHALIRDGLAKVAGSFPHATTYLAPDLGHAWPACDVAQFATLIRRSAGMDPTSP